MISALYASSGSSVLINNQIYIFNYILISLDNKAPCYLVLLDLSSAFDTLDHNILYIRLNEIGIYGQVHSRFMSFVSSRTSSVNINFSLSPPYVNMHGVHKALFLALYCSLFIFFLLNKFLTNIPISSLFR